MQKCSHLREVIFDLFLNIKWLKNHTLRVYHLCSIQTTYNVRDTQT